MSTGFRNSDDDHEIAEHYDFTNAHRGTMYRLLKDKQLEYVEIPDSVVLAPDVASVFPDSIAVNEALRTLIRLRSAEKVADARS